MPNPAISYGGGVPKTITSGLLVRRVYQSFNPIVILNNIVRLLQNNQTAQLAIQTTLDGWSSNALNIIPNTRFHVGKGKDFNDLSCNIYFTSTNTNDNGILFSTLEISLIVTLESGYDSFDSYSRASSYIACFEDILATYFLLAPFELVYITGNELLTNLPVTIETAEIIGTGIVASGALPGVTKSIGNLPTLRIKVVYQRNTTPNSL